MELIRTAIDGCFELRPKVFADDRGTFVKTFHRETFAGLGLATEYPEQFYSVSRQGVVRGLHMMLPPNDQAKLVTCTAGRVLDAIVDLRKGSPTFRQFALIELDAAKANMAYIPTGMAHGFYTRSESATMLYNTTTMHSPTHDAGIRWDSAGIPWPEGVRTVSARDAAFVALADFETPFA